jgi:alkylation response protein AidB-like acyl-CoA dehydrogenase
VRARGLPLPREPGARSLLGADARLHAAVARHERGLHVGAGAVRPPDRILAYEALDALERGTATDAQVALAKAAASRAVPEVTMLGQQVHGGQGYIEENDLYFFTLRGKDRSLAWGSAEECLRIVAETVEQPANWL